MKDSLTVLASLKPFQKRTVEFVYRRMYEDSSPAMKFLIADEVGLGKTLVAKGIIVKAIEKMQRDGKIGRIDIVYVCSNAAIARQNINRLNVSGEKGFAIASRLTLLPYYLKDIGSRKINFLSFTPGTTFDLKSSNGTWNERVLIYRMLRSIAVFQSKGFREMLRCYVAIDNWNVCSSDESMEFDAGTAAEFREAVLEDPGLCCRIVACSLDYLPVRINHENSLVVERNCIVAELRQKLARVCINKLEPDLVILDEFQRFKQLLHGESEASFLANSLMNYVDPKSNTHARVLLLSATPYKMYTLAGEDEDHYEDFIETLSFLLDSPVKLEEVKRNLEDYRLALLHGNRIASRSPDDVRDTLRSQLMSVMVRTERVGFTSDRNSMLVDDPVSSSVCVSDLNQAVRASKLATILNAGNIIEYWKSTPYLLNFMKGYVFKKNFEELLNNPDEKSIAGLREYLPYLISEGSISDFMPLDPGNPRLRSLVNRTVNSDLWKLLWMPPSLPYYKSTGAFASVKSPTKSLVFSSWNVVPDAIASICSYESERRMVRSSNAVVQYADLHLKVKQFLRFPIVEEAPASMTSLIPLYPSPTLAALIDPLEIALSWRGSTEPDNEDTLLLVREKLASFVTAASLQADESLRADLSWHWAVFAKIDALLNGKIFDWCTWKLGGWKEACSSAILDGEGFPEHVELFRSAFQNEFVLGPMPDNLLDIVSEVALGSPAICAARALHRIAPSLAWDDPVLMSAAAKVANGFRSLFNNPDSHLLIKSLYGDTVPMWRAALQYAIDGNIQATLDEYAHVLRESLGLFDHEDREIVKLIAQSMYDSLSIRVSSISVDQLGLDEEDRITKESFRMRCRFALRFADLIGEKDSDIVRAGTVREAFNSPFRPFVLASTSIGQEGLDFHTYCHEVWHWNLPSNPVDLEQREGRVHRYKGHAVRKNIAQCYGLEALRKLDFSGNFDPWETMFRLAEENGPENGNGIFPYWIFEDVPDPCKVRRVIPIIPFSREGSMLERLKKNLALYRLAFGQPRQEELLEILNLSDSEANKYGLSLQP
jgi:hypothetical protein